MDRLYTLQRRATLTRRAERNAYRNYEAAYDENDRAAIVATHQRWCAALQRRSEAYVQLDHAQLIAHDIESPLRIVLWIGVIALLVAIAAVLWIGYL